MAAWWDVDSKPLATGGGGSSDGQPPQQRQEPQGALTAAEVAKWEAERGQALREADHAIHTGARAAAVADGKFRPLRDSSFAPSLSLSL